MEKLRARPPGGSVTLLSCLKGGCSVKLLPHDTSGSVSVLKVLRPPIKEPGGSFHTSAPPEDLKESRQPTCDGDNELLAPPSPGSSVRL